MSASPHAVVTPVVSSVAVEPSLDDPSVDAALLLPVPLDVEVEVEVVSVDAPPSDPSALPADVSSDPSSPQESTPAATIVITQL